jgi:hypothetical protein
MHSITPLFTLLSHTPVLLKLLLLLLLSFPCILTVCTGTLHTRSMLLLLLLHTSSNFCPRHLTPLLTHLTLVTLAAICIAAIVAAAASCTGTAATAAASAPCHGWVAPGGGCGLTAQRTPLPCTACSCHVFKHDSW